MENWIPPNTTNKLGFYFVGSYLNQCAKVEAWTISMLAACDDQTSTSKIPHLFGQKLKAVRELAHSNPKIFNNPQRVIVLMNKFENPAKLRSNLAHSIVNQTSNLSGNFYLFQNTGTTERFWFSEDDMKTTLSDLTRLVKEIMDQKPKIKLAPSRP